MANIDLSVVVAVYNEHPDNLLRLVERLEQVLLPLSLKWEIVFVNDGSKAETSKALQRLARQYKHIQLVVLSRNFGQQAAISAGLDHARGRAIVNIDSDLQDPPELIPEMLKYWRAGYDVVYAQRSSRRDRFFKRFTAFLFYRLLAAVSSVEIPWDTGDFRLVDHRIVKVLNQMPEKTRFLRGQIPWLGFKQIGIPIDRGAREVGESTYTLKKLLKLALDGLLALSSAPLLLISTAGAIIFACGFIGLAAWFCLRTGMPAGLDNTALLACLTMLTGIQLFGLGLVAVYLARVLDEVRGRPTYVVGELVDKGRRYPDENRELTVADIESAKTEALIQAEPVGLSTFAPDSRTSRAEGSAAARLL
jgi:polyisoprenyl-phosphate glycosyltransferase